MEFDLFEKSLLSDLKNNDRKCIDTINENTDLINTYLNNNLDNLKLFLDKIEDLILKNEKENFKLVESVLKNENFKTVYENFKKSNILIEACKESNVNAIDWLYNIGVNSCVRDKNGMTALMHASKNTGLNWFMEKFLGDVECLNMQDNEGKTVLFHAVNNKLGFMKLTKSEIDINALNNNKESILIYCCKYEHYNNINYIISHKDIDVNLIDKDRKTAAMYLANKGRYDELRLLNKCQCNFDYINENHESVLSILIKNLYLPEEKVSSDLLQSYFTCIERLMHYNCNFNLPIDEYGNTPLMIFMMVHDYYSILYILNKYEDLDLSVKNKFGENACALCFTPGNKKILDVFQRNQNLKEKFDYDYEDSHHNTMLMLFTLTNNETYISNLLQANPNSLNKLNSKNENALIIATKLRRYRAVKELLNYPVNLDQQDDLGNTALHYAVILEDVFLVNILSYHKSNKDIKNKDGQSAWSLAKNQKKSNDILNRLENPDEATINNYKTNKAMEEDQLLEMYDRSNSSALNRISAKNKETLDFLMPCTKSDYCNINLSKEFLNIEKKIYKERKNKVDMTLKENINSFIGLELAKLILNF